MQHALVDDVDDIARCAGWKLGGKVAGEEDWRFGMDGEVCVPQGLVDIAGAVGLEGRGIVDQDGQRTESGGGPGNEGAALGAFGEIGLDQVGAAALAADGVAHGASTIGIGAIVDDDGMAGIGQSQGNGSADTVAGAGDEGD